MDHSVNTELLLVPVDILSISAQNDITTWPRDTKFTKPVLIQ